MIKNASVGDHVFWKVTYFDMSKGIVKTFREYALVVKKGEKEPGVVPEQRLNSISRKSFDEVVAESEVAGHEAEYMRRNSARA